MGFALVPGGGVEPPRPEGRRILSPLRLPVPPSRLYLQVPDFTTCLWLCGLSSKMTNVQLCNKVCRFSADFHSSLSFFP